MQTIKSAIHFYFAVLAKIFARLKGSFFTLSILLILSNEGLAKESNDVPPNLLKLYLNVDANNESNGKDFLKPPSTHHEEKLEELIKTQTEKISEAITSLAKPEDTFWQSIKPFLSNFLSSFLAIFSAIAIFYWQETYKIYRENLRNANKWILAGIEIAQSLERYKRNYTSIIGAESHPIVRSFGIPSMTFHTNDHRYELAELIFLLDKDADFNQWDKLPRIRALFENYRLAISLWNKHAEVHNEVKTALLKANGGAVFSNFNLSHLERLIDKHKIVEYVVLVEQAARLTDDLVVESHKFINEFPSLVSRRLKKRIFFKLGKLLTTTIKVNPEDKAMLPIPPISIDIFTNYSGLSKEYLEDKWKTGYPYLCAD